MVERAAQRLPQAEVKLGSAEDLPFPDADFTVVINVSSYHHWANPDAGLAEALRVLAPGGRLLIAEHKLKRRSRHGMNDAGAVDLTATLRDLGYATTSVDTVRAGRSDYLVVSATAPTLGSQSPN